MKLSEMSKDERSLLLYLETRAVDNGGKVDLRHMNEEDIDIAKKWNDAKFIGFGRIVIRHIIGHDTHWVKLSDEAWLLAHQEREARAKRMWDKKDWLSTDDNIKHHGIAAVRLGAINK